MQRLRHADLEGVVRFTGDVAAIDETEHVAFPQHLLESLRSLVGSDWVSYSELDRRSQHVLGDVMVPEDGIDEADDGAFWQLRHEHPVCSYQDRAGDFSPRKLSDFVTMRQLKDCRSTPTTCASSGLRITSASDCPRR